MTLTLGPNLKDSGHLRNFGVGTRLVKIRGGGINPDPKLIGAKNHCQQASGGPSEPSGPWFYNSP